MKPAKSSANRCYHSATMRRSPPRLPGGWHDRSAALGRRGDGCWDARRAQRSVAAFGAGHLHRHAHDRARRSVLRHQGRQPRRPRLRCGRARGGRGACGRRRRQARELSEGCAAARRCRRARRLARSRAGGARALAGENRRRHRLRRQDRHEGGAASDARAQLRDPCLARVLQQPLGGAALAGALPRQRPPCSVRSWHDPGMQRGGELEPLRRLVRPQVAIITTVEPVHLEFFGSLEAIADAKAEIFLGLERGGAAVINRDNPQFARLERSAQNAKVERIVSFGEHARADARLMKCSLQSDTSTVQARIFGTDVTYKLGAPGRHLVLNSLAVLAAAVLAGADLALAALALVDLQPAIGRGARLSLDVPGGKALLIDESYNANPASMRAALALLSHANVGPLGRRIAVLGDMLELGPR